MNEQDMQHGQYWQGEDLSWWILTEKFNGCRAYWDGENMWSRGGIKIEIPQEWRNYLPACHLDGEIYYGTDGVYKCGAAIRFGRFLPGMEFIVFDMPHEPGDYLDRLSKANSLIPPNPFIRVAQSFICLSNRDLITEMFRIQAAGGEGIMARHPKIQYTAGRTNQLLKVKEIPE
jgi:DNA ligase 1